MAKERIKINRKSDDGYKNISLRIKTETLKKVDELAEQSNRSRNELVNILLDNSIDNVEIGD